METRSAYGAMLAVDAPRCVVGFIGTVQYSTVHRLTRRSGPWRMENGGGRTKRRFASIRAKQ